MTFSCEIQARMIKYLDRSIRVTALREITERKRAEEELKFMSKTYPECPLYNPYNCKEFHSPKLCAIVKKDKICLKKRVKNHERK